MYDTALTFGRFNIPHYGHVDLVHKMVCNSEQALVYVSSGPSNNTWDLRVLMLKTLCRRSGLDLSKVSFRRAISPFKAVKSASEDPNSGKKVLVLGEDQFMMGIKIASDFDMGLILNERKFSSTSVRYLIDSKDTDSLNSCYNDKYPVRLAKLLRHEEVEREGLKKVARKAQEHTQDSSRH